MRKQFSFYKEQLGINDLFGTFLYSIEGFKDIKKLQSGFM
jgi:hypothetical protein